MTRSCGAGETLCGTGGDRHGDVIRGIRIAGEFVGLHVTTSGGKTGPGGSGLGPAGWRAAAPRAGCAGSRSAVGVQLRPLPTAAWLQNPVARRAAGGVWKPRLRPTPCSSALARASRVQGRHRAPCLADDLRRREQSQVSDGVASQGPRGLPGPHQNHPRPRLPNGIAVAGNGAGGGLNAPVARHLSGAQRSAHSRPGPVGSARHMALQP